MVKTLLDNFLECKIPEILNINLLESAVSNKSNAILVELSCCIGSTCHIYYFQWNTLYIMAFLNFTFTFYLNLDWR